MLIDEKTTTASDVASNSGTSRPLHEGVMDSTVGPQDVSDPTLGSQEEPNPPAYTQAVGNSSKAPLVEKWRPRHNDPRWSGDQDGNYSNIPPDSPSTSTGMAPKGIPPPGNLIHVYRRDGRITGEWHINPGLQVPSAFLPPPKEENETGKKNKWWNPEPTIGTDENGDQANLSLHTRDGKIVADVWVSDSSEVDTEKTKKRPTFLDLDTRDGTIQLRVRTHGSRPLRIRCHTNDGRIWVFLPRSFQGILVHEIRDGKLNFSEGLKPHATTFSLLEGKVGTSFVGNWRSLLEGGEADVSSWEGDKCEVSTRDGSVFFYWEDEYEEIMARRKSNWFKYMFQLD